LPMHLAAPSGAPLLRLQHSWANAEGSLWEGLSPWDASGSGVLEETVIDYDMLRRCWAPLPPMPAPAARTASGVLPPNLAQKAGIAVRASKLTPQSVRRALTEDMTAVTPEQAGVLANELAPLVRDAHGHLQIAVNRGGAESLNPVEAVLWAIGEISFSEARARLVATWYFLEEDCQVVAEQEERVSSLVADLCHSRPLKTLLQTILVARNVLGQQEREGYSASSLVTLQNERALQHVPSTFDPATGEVVPPSRTWLRDNCPTVLALVAEMLEATHIRRCRLRFMRMLAVGKLVPKDDDICRITWSFLDDLQESPRDVLQLLMRCRGDSCTWDLAQSITSHCMQLRHLLQQELAWVMQREVADTPFAQQLGELRVRVVEALDASRACSQRATSAAQGICRLGMQGRTSYARDNTAFEIATEVLCSLKHLGLRLAEEMRSAQEKQAAVRAAVARSLDRRGARCRAWAQVEVGSSLLWVTMDADIIRRLRRGLQQPQTPAEPAEPRAKPATQEAEAPAEARARTLASYSDMVHGGLEGVYRRDPASGRWGPRLDGVTGAAGCELLLGGPRPGI